MTEAEWLACENPQSMLNYLRGKASDRRVRLFAVACCRKDWHLLTDSRSKRAVEVAEQYADGLIGQEELITPRQAVRRVAWSAQIAFGNSHPWRAATAAEISLRDFIIAWKIDPDEGWQEKTLVLLDIFGNPFRQVSVDPAWRSWHDATIPRLAQQMYDSRDFASMPVLADALEEAGCTSADILNHCRQPGVHVRGCWVVDLLLGKE
jgi:hypothetical protein